MKIVIVEDYPDRLAGVIEQLNEMCPEYEVVVLYYNPKNDCGTKAEELGRKLSCNVMFANYWDLEEKLNELYDDSDTLFLFDTDIDRGAVIEVFEHRINVRYALEKRRNAENQKCRIWFYTTVAHLKCAIERTFGDYVIMARQNGALLSLELDKCPTFIKALEVNQAV